MFISKAMEVFITLAQERNLKGAAHKLCLTVPPVSRMLKNTEDWVGEKLVIIERNKISLTPTGEKIYQDVLPLYLALKSFTPRKSSRLLTISSPDIHTNSITNLINEVCKDFITQISVKCSDYIREDDDFFISFDKFSAPLHFSIYEAHIRYNLVSLNQLDAKPLNMEIVAGKEVLLSKNFQQELQQLKTEGFNSTLKQIDNSKIRRPLFYSGKSMEVLDDYDLKELHGDYFILRSYYQPVYIYANNLSTHKRNAELIANLDAKMKRPQ